MRRLVTRADLEEASIQTNTGLSQSAFARNIRVAKGTLLKCDQGRRQPIGPAKVLLAIIVAAASVSGGFTEICVA